MMDTQTVIARATELLEDGDRKSRIKVDRYVEETAEQVPLHDWHAVARPKLDRTTQRVIAVALGAHPESNEHSLAILIAMLLRAQGEPTTVAYRILSAMRRLLNRGIWTPHAYDALDVVRFFIDAAGHDTKVAARAVEHLIRAQPPPGEKSRDRGDAGNQESGVIFIGHGHSEIWRALKDFLVDSLHLPWEEFNRVSAVGVTTVDRLKEMLDRASFAFLVFTGEDEQADGSFRARQNVVHEAGLFQGKLGFQKAILLLEEGCEGFSNIAGLTAISFPKGKIVAAGEEIRNVLKREGILS